MTKTVEQGILDSLVDKISTRWGTNARQLLGDTIYEALLNSELLIRVAGLDESTDPSRVVSITYQVRSLIIDRMNRTAEG